jgi:DNA-binding transcriptional LysR family regulator
MTSFVKVVENGGFSAAARKLNLSASIISTHIRWLENNLRVRLLNRTTRKVVLTEVGRAYYEHCSRILSAIDEADRMAGELQSIPSGTMRLNTSPALSSLIAPVITNFVARHTAASIKMTMTDRMVDMVDEGYDLAIRMTPPPESSLIIRRLTNYQFVLCASPLYMSIHKPPQRPSDLSEHNCLRYTFFPFSDEWHFNGPAGSQSVRVSGNLECNSGEILRMASVQGQGIMLAPHFLVASELRSGHLVQLMPDFPPVDLTIDAIYPDRRYVPAKVRSFIDMVTEHLRSSAPRNQLQRASSELEQVSKG